MQHRHKPTYGPGVGESAAAAAAFDFDVHGESGLRGFDQSVINCVQSSVRLIGVGGGRRTMAFRKSVSRLRPNDRGAECGFVRSISLRFSPSHEDGAKTPSPTDNYSFTRHQCLLASMFQRSD